MVCCTFGGALVKDQHSLLWMAARYPWHPWPWHPWPWHQWHQWHPARWGLATTATQQMCCRSLCQHALHWFLVSIDSQIGDIGHGKVCKKLLGIGYQGGYVSFLWLDSLWSLWCPFPSLKLLPFNQKVSQHISAFAVFKCVQPNKTRFEHPMQQESYVNRWSREEELVNTYRILQTCLSLGWTRLLHQKIRRQGQKPCRNLNQFVGGSIFPVSWPKEIRTLQMSNDVNIINIDQYISIPNKSKQSLW